MRNLAIENMVLTTSETTPAFFDVAVDGWRVRGCKVVVEEDGYRKVVMPRVPTSQGAKRSSVEMPSDLWHGVRNAALAHLDGMG